MKILKLILILSLFGAMSSAQNITIAEYYFDGNDLGFGANNSFPVTQVSQSATIPTAGLDDGFHDLHIRVFDQAANEGNGAWSHYDRITFYITEFPSNQDIVAARYYFNNDAPQALIIDFPGTSVSQSYQIDTSSLGEGFHDFYIQTQNSDGVWSLYDRQTFYIKDFSDMSSDIVAAEYFIDVDPGYGSGEPFNITGNPYLLNLTTDTDISEGDHLLCVRVQNMEGEWSSYCCATFNVDSSLSVEESLFKSTTIYPNPFVDDLQIRTDRSEAIESAVIFDLTGKVIFKSIKVPTKLELGHLNQGTYLLKLVTASKEANFKIVKQ